MRLDEEQEHFSVLEVNMVIAAVFYYCILL